MFDDLIKLFNTALSLWSDKEKTKYIDELISLKQRYNAEYNKPLSERDDATLDNLVSELRILADAFTSSVGKSNTQIQSGQAGS